MTEATLASRVYAAYAASLRADEIADLPQWLSLPDKGAAWIAVTNARATIAAPPADVAEPYDYELSAEIPTRRVCDVFKSDDTSVYQETIPTSLRIRPLVASDLCLPEFGTGTMEYNLAIRARAHAVDVSMLNWRVDPVDANVANTLLAEATGRDAAAVMSDVFLAAGGELVSSEIGPWSEAALALLADEQGETYLVTCRTEGFGTVKVGPLRPGHDRIHQDVAERGTEWGGRLAALAKATGKSLDEIRGARIEDTNRLWACYQLLKKKVVERSRLLIAARSSTRTMAAGAEPTSTNSPSES